MGFESAAILSHLLAKAQHPTQIPGLLRLYNSARRPRTNHVMRGSKRTSEIWQLPDGPLQVDRDRQFAEDLPPSVGYPNMLDDPVFQEWLFGFDAKECAEREWDRYVQENISAT
jgi:salicylate hydroxylase